MAFTEDEKARVKHFLFYPDWVNLAASIQLGIPAGSQPLFIVEQAFQRLTQGGEASVRIDLCNCEEIEAQMSQSRRRFTATQLGELHTNRDEPRQLRGEMVYWRQKLADDLGVANNPYSQSSYEGDAGGINSRVVG